MDKRKKIEAILGPGGILAKVIPGYEHRKQQVRMAWEVLDALESRERLVVEAPTGTGKTLAYLIAAALSRKRVAISTGTKNLQEQLFSKDIPFVQANLFPGLKAALLKGRSNFICHSRLTRYLRQPSIEAFGGMGSLKTILDWYRATHETGTGDRAELDTLPDDDPVWPEICSTSETCAGKRCPDKDNCFVLRMRARAAEADVMIVNHHLLTSDLAVRESGFGQVIPRYEALVVDEAHGLEEAATQHFGFHTSQFKMHRLARDARYELDGAGVKAEKFDKTLKAVDESARILFGLFAAMGGFAKRLKHIDPECAATRDQLRGSLDTLRAMIGNLPKASEELRTIGRRASEAKSELETILSDPPDVEYACWVERRERAVMLHASPVEVGALLQQRLYRKVDSVVFTSATLSSGKSFDYFKSRVGLEGEPAPREIMLDSPFDYARQTILYIPQDVPEPASSGFVDALVPVVQEVLMRTQGRAFVLFTSHRNMEAAYRKLEKQVPFPLLIQGSKPKSRLLTEFRERQGSVLFGTSSFWEGVDVQGEALSCVIIDRLPFAVPDDPVVSARIERLKGEGIEPFRAFQVPMAVIALKQGLGRLIRTRSDRGVLCILDQRILTKSYGGIFRQSLHNSPICRDLKQIERFFTEASEEVEAQCGG